MGEWKTESERHEGSWPLLWLLEPGITRLRVETAACFVIETPVWVAVAQKPFGGTSGE